LSERNQKAEDFESFFRFLDGDNHSDCSQQMAETLTGVRPVSADRSHSTIPSITAFEECAAILEHDGGTSRIEAGRAAAKELGFPHPRAFYVACLKTWQTAIETIALPHAGTDEERLRAEQLTALQHASLAFLAAGDVPMQALSSGWDELQLFGIHEGLMPTARLDAWGLIPLLAWSVPGLELADIDSGHALVVSAGGGVLKHPRFRANHNEAVQWWMHHRFLIERINHDG
jgi:hypothetical protein